MFTGPSFPRWAFFYAENSRFQGKYFIPNRVGEAGIKLNCLRRNAYRTVRTSIALWQQLNSSVPGSKKQWGITGPGAGSCYSGLKNEAH